MKIRGFRALALASTVPAFALGLACMTTQSEKPASAQGEKPSAGAATGGTMPGHASDRVISGRVARASEDALIIDSEDGSKRTLAVVPETAVLVNGQAVQITDLQPGQDVRASYSDQAGQPIAVRVESGASASTGAAGTGAGASTSASQNPPDTGSKDDAGEGGTSGTAAPNQAIPESGSRW